MSGLFFYAQFIRKTAMHYTFLACFAIPFFMHSSQISLKAQLVVDTTDSKTVLLQEQFLALQKIPDYRIYTTADAATQIAKLDALMQAQKAIYIIEVLINNGVEVNLPDNYLLSPYVHVVKSMLQKVQVEQKKQAGNAISLIHYNACALEARITALQQTTTVYVTRKKSI